MLRSRASLDAAPLLSDRAEVSVLASLVRRDAAVAGSNLGRRSRQAWGHGSPGGVPAGPGTFPAGFHGIHMRKSWEVTW